uniref:NAD(P)(+)--arginine ADP-ribosyltransferase n=1 Tax=Pseudonaja textilis TaxID=8673 RepID=A0A670ZJC7_PSETE
KGEEGRGEGSGSGRGGVGGGRERGEEDDLPVAEKYRRTWETAKRHWDRLGPSVSRFDPLYGTALVAYTVGDDLYRDFNTATREAGRSRASYRHYAFRDFHFLLTKAVQAKAGGGVCYQVFRGIQNVRFTLSDEATVVRFGQFASSSLDKTVAINYGQDTFFSIRTCYGARMDDVSYHPNEKEVLIPPYEIFAVMAYHQTENGVHITLESRGVFSRRNCDSVNGKRPGEREENTGFEAAPEGKFPAISGGAAGAPKSRLGRLNV